MAWTRKLSSGRWQGGYRDPFGNRRSTGSFARKADALTAAEEQESRMRRGDWIDPALSRTTFAEWAEHFMATNLHQRPTTRARDESSLHVHLLPAFGPLSLSEIDPVAVQRWVARLAESLKPSSVHKTYSLLRRMMATAEESGYISRTPCRGVKLPRIERNEMRYLTAAELEHLAEAVPQHYRALILTLGYGGLRWAEAAGLKRSRLNLLQANLEVVGSLVEVKGRLIYGEPKTATSRRSISLPAFLVAELEHHLAEHARHPDFVFSGRDGGALRKSFRARVWEPAVAAAGLPPLRPHDLRHTCAALLIANGEHPKVVQSHLGHSSIQVTLDRYGHLFPNVGERVAEGLEAARTAALGGSRVAHLSRGE